MDRYAKVDKHQMAQMNKQTVMRCIAEHGPVNRAGIARRVGLSLPSVMQITDELMLHGMVVAQTSAVSKPGKKAELLSLSGESHRFVGVDIGRTTIRIVVMGLNRSLIASLKFPTRSVDAPSAFVDMVCDGIHRALKQSAIDLKTVVGVCVAMPGLIEEGTGTVLFSPNFGWKDVPLQRWMNERLPWQVIVENANRAQGMWEVCTHPEDMGKKVVCMGLGYGIGGAILEEGRLYYGASGTSGELGHITVTQKPVPCTCGNYGCLETMASGAAIARDARAAVAQGRETLLSKLKDDGPEAIDAKAVFDAAAAGDPLSRELLGQAAEYVGIGLGSVINVLDPDVIYLCGGMMHNGDRFLRMIQDATSRRQMTQAGRKVVIRAGSPTEWNVAMGATQVIPYARWKSELMDVLR
ncbi:MAG: ROK family protein [Clostridia bacterium]|nr:ROK family protein [Clostridia bacterium]